MYRGIKMEIIMCRDIQMHLYDQGHSLNSTYPKTITWISSFDQPWFYSFYAPNLKEF